MASQIQLPIRPRSEFVDSLYEAAEQELNADTIHGMRRHFSRRNAAITPRDEPISRVAWPSSTSVPSSARSSRSRFSGDESLFVAESSDTLSANDLRSGKRRASKETDVLELGFVPRRAVADGSHWNVDDIDTLGWRFGQQSDRPVYNRRIADRTNLARPSRPPKIPIRQNSAAAPEVVDDPVHSGYTPLTPVYCGVCKIAIAGELALPGASHSTEPVPACQDCFADTCFSRDPPEQPAEDNALAFVVPRIHDSPPPSVVSPSTGATAWIQNLLRSNFAFSPIEDEAPPPRYEELDVDAALATEPGESARSGGTRNCVVCDENLADSDFPHSPLTLSCEHENSACIDCVQTWIETQLTDQTWDRIKCLECNEMMQYDDVRRHASDQTFVRYDQLAARSAINSDPDFIYCKRSGCDSGQFHEGGDNMPLFRCKTCGFKYCIIHEEPWHEGKSCAAFDREMNGQDAVEEGEEMDELTRQLVETEGFSRDYRDARSEGGRRNPYRRHESRFHHRRERSRAESSQASRGKKPVSESQARMIQMQLDYDAALALHIEEGGDANDFYPPNFDSNRSSTPEHFKDDPTTSPSSSARDSGPRQKWSKRKSDYLANKGQHEESSQNEPAWNPQSAAADAEFAQALQREYEQQEQSRLTERTSQEQRIRQRRGEEKRANCEQSERDAAEAQRLHKRMEREEKERQKTEAEQSRQDYQRRKAEEKQGEQTVKANSKQCPRCHWSIQKTAGCEHMTCSQCRHEFCWLCLGDYNSIRTRGNMAHNRGCAHRL